MRIRKKLSVVCTLLVLLCAAYTGWRVWQVQSELDAAATSAHRLRQALRSGNQHAAEEAQSALRDHSAAAADRTGGPLWSVLAAAPVLGDDAAAVRTLSQTLQALSDEGIPPLVAFSETLDSGDLAPRGGTVPVSAFTSVAEPVQEASQAFTVARGGLGGVGTDGLLEPVRRPFANFTQAVGDVADALAAAEKAVRLIPSMLGSRRHYLLVVQNNAEVRATGGMPGALALVDTHDGRIRMSRQATASGFPELDRPVLPLTAQERAVFGTQLGTFFQDANFSPDFPRAAELLAARWRQRYGGTLDGVVSVDPVALSYQGAR
jgi:hypothetical protein